LGRKFGGPNPISYNGPPKNKGGDFLKGEIALSVAHGQYNNLRVWHIKAS